MICPGCKLDTPADKKYCEFCGIALDLDFDKVEEAMGAEIEEEQKEETEKKVRSWFILACFIGLIAIASRTLVREPYKFQGVGPTHVMEPTKTIEPPNPLPIRPIKQAIPKED